MTPPSQPDPAWKRLGDLLIQRRAAIDPRYTKRQTFCDEAEVDYRVVSDIERARRTNFSPPMISALETAYRLTRGNIDRILQGGDLEPAAPSARISQTEFKAPAPSGEGDVVIYVNGQTQTIRAAGNEPEPDPEAILGSLTEHEAIIWAMRGIRWQARVTAIRGMRAGIRAALAADRHQATSATKPSTRDFGHASSDG